MLTSLTDANGGTHTFEYDSYGRLVRDSDPAGGVQTLARVEAEKGWTAARSVLDVGTFSYAMEQLPAGGYRRTTSAPGAGSTVMEDSGDGTTSVTSPDGTRTVSKFGPDPRFRFGAPIATESSITTPGGLSTTVTKARNVVLSDPQNPMSVVSLTDTTTINGRITRNVFNAATRTLTSTSPANRKTVATLDVKGRPVSMQIGTLTPTTYEYDELGRLVSQTQGTRTTTFTYDERGYLATVTDPLDRTVRFTNDARGRRVEQIFPDNRRAAFTYDGNGNLTGLTPPGGTAHQLAYTSINRLETYTAPEVAGASPVTAYTFNRAAQPTKVTRPDGLVLEWAYDDAGRVSVLTTPEGETSYSYVPASGQLARITSPNSTLTYAYDGGLQTSETWAGLVAGTITWTYDNSFRLASEQVRGGSAVAFQYDNDGLLTRAGAVNFTRDATHGFITTAVVGGVATTYTYNALGEIASEETKAGATVIYRAVYARDAAGRLSQKTETVAGVTTTETYTYDLAGRLTDVTRGATPVAHYEYDTNGNRTLGDGVPATYDPQDRLVTHGSRAYSHSAAGDVSGWIESVTGESKTYTYDVQGNLIEVRLPGGSRVQYGVDARNRRIAKRVDGATVQGFLYQGQLRPVAELDGTGAVISRFVYGARVAVPEYVVKGGSTYRLVIDLLGSVRLVVDTASNVIVQRLDYDAFGQVVLDTNPGFQPFGYAGGLYDTSTGLVRFGARDYDPAIGRWLSKDPIGFNGADSNLYAYVGNDPMNAIDPTGLIILHPGDVLDWVSFGSDTVALIKCPGWGTGGAWLLSVIGLLPGISGLGWLDEAADAGRGAVIIIGENMARVEAYADKVGGLTIGNFIPNVDWDEAANLKWIQDMKAAGHKIIDIGPDFARRAEHAGKGIRPDSAIYNMERRELTNYSNYEKAFERTGKYSGTVPDPVKK